MKERQLSADELRLLAGRSLFRWAAELERRLSADDAARLLLGGALAAFLQAWGPDATVAAMRELAERVEAGEGGFHVGRA